MTKILLVDDEIEIIEDRSRIIRNLGYVCVTAQSGKEAIKLLAKENPDIVLTDLKMTDGDGFASIWYGWEHGYKKGEIATALELTEQQVKNVIDDISRKKAATEYLRMQPL